MTAVYQARIYDTAGNLNAILDLQSDVRTLEITHRVNYPSTLTLSMYGLSSAIGYLTLDAIIQIKRRVQDASLDWYTEFVGFHRTPQRQITSQGNRIFTSHAVGLLDLIRRRSIRYYVDTAGNSKGPDTADNIIKAFVNENAGPAATIANGRITSGVTTGQTVAANTSQAASISTAHSWKNLLSTIREIGEANKVDFDNVWGGEASPATFVFTTYYPQLGTDRRAGTANPMVFSTGFGNMTNPDHTQSRTEEVSSVLVLGPGQGNLRDTTLRTGTHVADSIWNLIEEDKDASSEDRLAALQNIGDQVLYDKRPAVKFTFQPIQTPSATYGKHYFLGDLVTGTFDDLNADVKIRSVRINLHEAGERIELELEEVPS